MSRCFALSNLVAGAIALVLATLAPPAGAQCTGVCWTPRGSYSFIEFTGPVGIPVFTPVSSIRMEGARPNPARVGTGVTLSYSLPRASSSAELAVFSLAGRRVATLVHGALPAGPGSVRWDGHDSDGRAVSAGIYFARLTSEDGAVSGKIVLSR